MPSYSVVWEDEEANRKVDVLVNYSFESEQVTIDDITPVKVTFHNKHEGSTPRSIGVWTKGGKRMLSRQFQAANCMDNLSTEIAAAHCETVG